MFDEENNENSKEESGVVSKSQRKREMLALQSLGEKLIHYNEKQLATLELPESLFDAILEAKRMKGHHARLRQGQYIGKLMRRLDEEMIAKLLQYVDLNIR